MGKYVKRVVSTSFWEDPKVMTLFTPEDKYFMLYLLTNPHTTQLGIYHLVPKIAAFEMGYSLESVLSLIDRFENKYGIIRYNNETMEVAIKNYLKHSIVKGGKPVLDCLMQDAKGVKDKSLLTFISESVNDEDLVQTVKTFLQTIKEESTKEENIINDNDNDNDSNVDVTSHDTSTIRKRNVDDVSKLRGHDLELAKTYGFTVDEGLLSAFTDFYRMRKSIKKPMSERAVLMLRNELEKLAPGDIPLKISILNQSSFYCWQGVYPIKSEFQRDSQTDYGKQVDLAFGDWQ